MEIAMSTRKTSDTANPPAPKVCAECGNKFFGTLMARYCSDACRMRSYRRRRARGRYPMESRNGTEGNGHER